ncbi:hypothetical protein C8R45DRAFT_575583 [Mycena sanguinolenta]|nr:hypothetical protein C8R45DRAFT_575583 [Mycena sanguinolenta]
MDVYRDGVVVMSDAGAGVHGTAGDASCRRLHPRGARVSVGSILVSSGAWLDCRRSSGSSASRVRRGGRGIPAPCLGSQAPFDPASSLAALCSSLPPQPAPPPTARSRRIASSSLSAVLYLQRRLTVRPSSRRQLSSFSCILNTTCISAASRQPTCSVDVSLPARRGAVMELMPLFVSTSLVLHALALHALVPQDRGQARHRHVETDVDAGVGDWGVAG